MLLLGAAGGQVQLGHLFAGAAAGVLHQGPHPQAGIALFHRGGPQGEGGVREAEAKGIQGLYPKGIEIAVAQVDALPVHGDRPLVKGLGRGRGLQAVVAVGEDVLRVVLVPGEVLPGGVVLPLLGNGHGQLAGGVHLAGEQVGHSRRALVPGDAQEQQCLHLGMGLHPREVHQAVGVQHHSHLFKVGAQGLQQRLLL